MSSEIFKKKTFLGAKLSSNGRSEGMPGLALKQHFTKGAIFSMLSNFFTLYAEQFSLIFWKKKTYFNAFESHLARVQSHLKNLNF